jgi:hypothetical protein
LGLILIENLVGTSNVAQRRYVARGKACAEKYKGIPLQALRIPGG